VAGFHHFEYRRDRFRRACRGNAQAEFHYQTHAIDFLSYSYLQSGQEAKARELIEHTKPTSLGRVRKIKPIIAPILPRGLRSSCTVGKKQPPCRFQRSAELE